MVFAFLLIINLKTVALSFYLGVSVTLFCASLIFFIKKFKLIFLYFCATISMNILYMATSNLQVLTEIWSGGIIFRNTFTMVSFNIATGVFLLLSNEILHSSQIRVAKFWFNILLSISALLVGICIFIDNYAIFMVSTINAFLCNIWCITTGIASLKRGNKQSIPYLAGLALFFPGFIYTLFNKLNLSTSTDAEYFFTILVSLVNTSSIVLSIFFETKQVEVLPIRVDEKLDILFLEKYGFTKREEEVTQILVTGATDKEISEKLHLSVFTIKSHLRNIYEKTGVKNRLELVVRLKS